MVARNCDFEKIKVCQEHSNQFWFQISFKILNN